MIWLLLFLLFGWFCASGTEYAYIIGATVVAIFVLSGLSEHLAIVPQRIFSQLDVFSLMALPLFILAGEVMGRGGVTIALVDFSMALMGRVRGAMGHVNILSSVFFAGVSGSATADAAALGNTLVPAMTKQGYTGVYAASITSASAIIGPIIPPSIVMIMYGALMDTDIAALFAAGIFPGLLLAASLMLANGLAARRYGHPKGEVFSWQKIGVATRHALPALALPVVILAGIVFGVTTPTEAGALAVLAALLAARVYGHVTRSMIVDSLRRSVVLTGSIFLLIAAASLVSYLAALSGLAVQISQLVTESGLQGQLYLFGMVIVLLVFGMFTGVRIGLFLVVPLIVPEAISQGADPVHVGIVVCLSLTLGLITPPFGPILLIVSAVTGVPYGQLAKSTSYFALVIVGLLAVIILVPSLSLWLPRRAGLL